MATIEEYFEETVRLPSPPSIALKILDAVRSDTSSMDEVARIVMADPALTARILKVANSSLYNLRVPVNSIGQASVLIGAEAIRNVALAFVIVESFDGTPEGSFDIDLFWRRSITSAVGAEVLAKQTGLHDHDIFISSLLQDIGVLVMFLTDPINYSMMLDDKRISGIPVAESEWSLYGFTHADVGGRMLEEWGLPDSITQPVLMHHEADETLPYFDSAQVVGMSNRISSVYHGTHSARQLLNAKHDLAQAYGLADDECDRMIDMIGAKSRDVISLFQVDPGEMKPFSWIVQEANAELGQLNLSYEQLVLELKQQKEKAERLARELKKANNRFRDVAFRDELTGLENRRFFLESLEAELHRGMRYKRGFSLLKINLDRFKELNDKHGHLAGDRVLETIGQLLKTQVRRCDVVARYGGDEFALILPETDLKGARMLGQRLCETVDMLRIQHGQVQVAVTVSVGSATYHESEHPISVLQLVEQCDRALGRAKQNGRNRVEIEF